jgi:peptidoglycan/LPS O-acetylase OafA/YrhL
MLQINDKTRNIPSLDGMRAISIALVLIGHSNEIVSRFTKIPQGCLLALAHTGVMVFFVISGFLITNLLMKECNATGDIRLKRFYLRRAFRIFPPFYVYLGIIFLLTLVGVFHAALQTFLAAALYSTNYYVGRDAGFIGVQHIWSLSIEEQFYLLWPALLLWLGRRKSISLALVILLVSPLVRAITYQFLAPQNRAMVDRMFHSSMDTIMFGCLLALLWRSERFLKLARPLIADRTGSLLMGVAVVFLLVLDPVLNLRYRGGYHLLAGMTLQGLAISAILLRVVHRPEKLSGRLLNVGAVRHIGIISYSLYLWQNIIIGEWQRFFPFDLLALLAVAEASYWLVERPALRLRDRIEARFQSRRRNEQTVQLDAS